METGLVIVEEPIEEMFSQATPEVVEKWEHCGLETGDGDIRSIL